MDTHFESKTSATFVTLLPIIILIEGFVSISIEIITIRQILPVAGGSVIVTSLIIGIFLLFLALGYKKGGQLQANYVDSPTSSAPQDDALRKTLSYNFLLAALWLGIGLSYIFTISFFTLIQTYLGHHVIYPLIAYLLFIIAPLIYILGQTIPITMHMSKQNKSVGMVGGDTMSLSTIGSFLGATITSLIFMQYFGVAWTIFINYILLFGLFFLLFVNKQNILFWLCLSIATTWLIYGLNIQTERNLFVLTNNYANYQVLNNKNFNLKAADEKILSINNSLSSYTNAANQSFPYLEFIKHMLFVQLRLRSADILVLGAGGFTFSAENEYDNRFTYIDIDKQIKDVVLQHFLAKINGELIADDARHYAHAKPKQYQAILVDAYTNVRTIPAYLLTFQFMQELQKLLTPNGTVILNMIINPTLKDQYSKRIDNTIRSIFKNCMAIPARFVSDGVTNVLYVCTNANNQKDNTIYSDNMNTSTTDSFEW